jgi:hypothetical protein
MPVKTFGQLTTKMYHTMDALGSDTIDVLDLFERWTLDAIGISGFGNSMSIIFKLIWF